MAGNWVDFENEIRRVIEFADRTNLDLDEKASLLLNKYKGKNKYFEGIKGDIDITVFYYDKDNEGELIANMVSLIGEDKVLEKSDNSRLRFIKLDELDI